VLPCWQALSIPRHEQSACVYLGVHLQPNARCCRRGAQLQAFVQQLRAERSVQPEKCACGLPGLARSSVV